MCIVELVAMNMRIQVVEHVLSTVAEMFLGRLAHEFDHIC